MPSSKVRSPSTDSEDDEEGEVGTEVMGLMEEVTTVDGSENELVVDAPPLAPEAKGNIQIISRRDEMEDSMDMDEKAKEVLDGWKAKYEVLLSEVLSGDTHKPPQTSLNPLELLQTPSNSFESLRTSLNTFEHYVPTRLHHAPHALTPTMVPCCGTHPHSPWCKGNLTFCARARY
jgi:hypothetical protein